MPHVEDAFDIEDDEELAVEAMDACGNLGEPCIEVDGIGFAGVVVELEHFADGIDEEPVAFPLALDADRHRGPLLVALGQSEPAAHVDGGDDAAAQVEHAGDLRPRQRHPGQALRHEHVLHPRDRQAEQLAAQQHRDVFDHGFTIGIVLNAHRGLPYAATSTAAMRSLSAAIRPGRSNFATYSWKPTSRPRSTASAEVSEDSAMIGTAAVRGSLRTASASS